jgi:DNA invertase Pin-like site-specific DNA recombinase
LPHKKPAGKIGVIYGRYSSHAQKDASIEQQVEECTKYAAEKGIEITHVYADRAVSGKTDIRADFQRMMKDAEKGKFNCVIAWKSNRIGRNMLQALLNEAKLTALGIRVLYTEEDFDDSAAGRFALRSMMNVNQFYSENMAEDVKRGLYDNAANCKITNGHLPFGYKKGENLSYALDKPKDDIVREIFDRVARGTPFVDIANDLNARGIKTSRGGLWGKHSFHVLITNERYTGVYIYGHVRIEGGIPQIIDKELFCQVQEVLKTKKNPQGRHRVNGDYRLTGKLFCGKCDSFMTGVSGTGKSGKLHHYYACHKQRTEKTCDKTAVRRNWIETEVANAVKTHILQDEIIQQLAAVTAEYSRMHNHPPNIVLLEQELTENKKAIKNLLTAIEQGIITSTTKHRLLKLEEEQSLIIGKLAIEKADLIAEVTEEQVTTWLESFRNGDITDDKYQTKLFDAFLVSVHVYDDHLIIAFAFSGNKNKLKTPINKAIVNSKGVRLSSLQRHQN